VEAEAGALEGVDVEISMVCKDIFAADGDESEFEEGDGSTYSFLAAKEGEGFSSLKASGILWECFFLFHALSLPA